MMFKLQEIAFVSQKKKKKKSPHVFIITPRQKVITQSFPGSIFLNLFQKLGSVSWLLDHTIYNFMKELEKKQSNQGLLRKMLN